MTNKSENKEVVEKQPLSKTEAVSEQPKQAPANVLLGTISYNTDKDLDAFLEKLDVNQAIFALIASANYSQAKGVYSLAESELISKAIKTIKNMSNENAEKTPPVGDKQKGTSPEPVKK